MLKGWEDENYVITITSGSPKTEIWLEFSF